MKTTFLFAAFLLILTVAPAKAQNCKYTVDTKDAETGVATKKISCSISNEFLVWINAVDNKKSLSLELVYAGINKEVINKGDSCLIQFADGSAIDLIALEKASPAGKADDVLEITQYNPSYALSDEQLSLLKNGTVQLIRIQFGKANPVLTEIPEKKAKKISEAARCF